MLGGRILSVITRLARRRLWQRSAPPGEWRLQHFAGRCQSLAWRVRGGRLGLIEQRLVGWGGGGGSRRTGLRLLLGLRAAGRGRGGLRGAG